jgi:predicted RNase H-like HicB family nuclease
MKNEAVIVHRERNWYVAESPRTGVVSQGRTPEEAAANLEEAIELYEEVFPPGPGNETATLS